MYLKEEGGGYRIHVLNTTTLQSSPILMSEPLLKGSVGLSLSPDRKWIAFTADFKRTSADYQDGAPRDILWKVRVDGTQLQRLTLPLDPSILSKGQRIYYSTPRWSPDARNIFFLHAQFSGETTDERVGFNTLAKVPSEGGVPKVVEFGKCGTFLGDMAFRPNTSELLISESRCGSATVSEESIKLVDLTFSSQVKEIISHRSADGNVVVAGDGLSWMPDGSGFVLVVNASWTGANQTSVSGRGLVFYNMNNGQYTYLVAPEDKNDYFTNPTISPDGNYLVFANNRNGRKDMRLFFLSKALRGEFFQHQPLTQDGKSSYPTW